MAAIAGLRGTGDWATDERPKNFREYILWRNPNGSAPLYALMAKMADESVNDPEFAWWDEPLDIVRFQVNGALTNVATALVIDSSDPSTGAPDARWGLGRHAKPGDLFIVEPATEPQTQSAEIIMITAVTSDTALTIARGQAGTTAAAIADNAFLTKIGSAYSEGSNAPDGATRNPIKYFNYTQIFKTAYEVTRTSTKTKTRTGDSLANDRKRKMFDHSRDIEMALMMGQRFEGTGSNGKPIRFTGGLRQFIPTTTSAVLGGAVTLSTFMNAVYPVFDWDSPAGNERICFCGNVFMNNLNLLARQYGQIQFQGQITSYGLNLTKWVLPQGTLYFKTHPLMNRYPLYQSASFVIDPSSLRWRYITDTMFEDQIQTPGQDSRKGQWLTEGGLEVRFAGRTNGFLAGFTGVA